MGYKTDRELQRFRRLMDDLLAVPHKEIERRMKEYDEKARLNPRRRGPKPGTKRKASVSRAPVDET